MDTIDPFRAGTACASGEASDRVQRERMPRNSLLLDGTLREADETTVTTVRIRNLSAGGLMAEHDTHYPRGTAVEIELHGIGKIAGRIAWATDGRMGIAFDHAIDPMAARKPVGQAGGGHEVASRPPR